MKIQNTTDIFNVEKKLMKQQSQEINKMLEILVTIVPNKSQNEA